MSGLGAIFHTDGASVIEASLTRMESSLSLYGPDRKGRHLAGNIGLCWTQLGGFVPEDRNEAQPVVSDGLSLIFSGYLTERDELADILGVERTGLGEVPDSALLMKAWQKWQSEAPKYVHGRFSAIVADRNHQNIFAFRTPFGAPPIFYHQSNDRLAIATVPKGIFALGDVPRQLNERRIADSLILNYQDTESSYYKALRRVPLGCMLVAGRSGCDITRFYDLRSQPRIRYTNDDDYVEAARELLAQSVRSAMRVPKTPAAMLSSGYDSSTVVVAMLEQLGWAGEEKTGRLATYTHIPEAGWDGRTYGADSTGDESGGVRALAERYPAIATNFISSDGAPLDRDLDMLIGMAEIPPRNVNNLYWAMDVRKRAAADGNRVLLGGQSGDATISFSGRPLYATYFRKGNWSGLIRELRASGDTSRFAGLYGKAIRPNLPSHIAKRIASLRGQTTQSGYAGYSAIAPEYTEEMCVERTASEAGWDDGFGGPKSNREAMLGMLTSGLRDETQSLAYALEAVTRVQLRDPLGDRRLVEFCFGLPEHQFLQNGVQRRLLKRMMARKLPEEILTAPRGRQAADWHLRITRELPRYREELDRLGKNADMARRLDLPRLQRLLESWPERTPLSGSDHEDFALAMVGLARALATARYVNWVEGNNR